VTRRTKKVGNAGRYGPRYGVRIRKQITSIAKSKNQAYECPRCKHEAVRRVSTGIWQCRRCDLKFAGGAYHPNVISRAQAQMPTKGEAEVIALNSDTETEEEA
jgi:large subunit ribosomal protein L37Ae